MGLVSKLVLLHFISEIICMCSVEFFFFLIQIRKPQNFSMIEVPFNFFNSIPAVL